jgi:hypothetical protein
MLTIYLLFVAFIPFKAFPLGRKASLKAIECFCYLKTFLLPIGL